MVWEAAMELHAFAEAPDETATMPETLWRPGMPKYSRVCASEKAQCSVR
jgi:hypothetical protein